MKFKIRISIGYKLSLAFGFLTIAFVFFSVVTFDNLQSNKRLTYYITNESIVSENLLNDLYIMIDNTDMLAKNWVFIETDVETTYKKKLKSILLRDFKDLKNKLDQKLDTWPIENVEKYNDIIVSVNDTLFPMCTTVMSKFAAYSSYSDSSKRAIAPLIDRIETRVHDIGNQIKALREYSKQSTLTGYKAMNYSFENFQSFTVIIAIIIFIVSVVIATLTTRTVLLPVRKIKDGLTRMSNGILEKRSYNQRNDELGDMLSALEKLNNGLIDTSNFSLEIGQGHYNVQYSPMSGEDALGNSLLTLRDNLEKATKDAEERKKIDDIQNWATNGLAKFAELLRTNNENISTLGKVVISNIVKYMNINQGGLFVSNDEDPNEVYLELIAVYAYDRDKYAEKKVYPGEGLVGTCFVEKETVYMTEVPESYIAITSGLGNATPKSILIVPLKMEDEVLGVIELASFNSLQEYEIEFVEKIAESIASTLTNARINEQTNKLLGQSNSQAEAMKQQEEAMQQNMEEMLSTQEDATRKEEELREMLRVANQEIEVMKSRLDQA